MAPNSRSSGKIKQSTFWLSFLTILVIVLAACGGSNSTTQVKRPAHPNSLTMLANQQDA